MFLRSLEAVAGGWPRLNDERRRSLNLALRYFRESAPKHTADEEESLFSRLRSVGDEELKTVLAKVEALFLLCHFSAGSSRAATKGSGREIWAN
jgi:hypothetical protein